MLLVLGLRVRVQQDFVDAGTAEIQVAQNVVNESQECLRDITKSKGHMREQEESEECYDDRLRDVL